MVRTTYVGHTLLSRCLMPQYLLGLERGQTELLVLYQCEWRPPTSGAGPTVPSEWCIFTDTGIRLSSFVQGSFSTVIISYGSSPLATYVISKKMLSVGECSHYNDHLDTLSVQCKLKDSVSLEACCGTWNRLMLGCHPGQLSFILRAASDTLPTAVNLQRWHIQCSAKCPLCGCVQPTTAHILNGLVSGTFYISAWSGFTLGAFWDSGGAEPGMRASESPQGTIP